MGVENALIIEDTQITASSSRDKKNDASHGRLYGVNARTGNAWIPAYVHSAIISSIFFIALNADFG